MGSLQDDLDAISARQGKNVPPGNFIAGFGPGSPPPPSFDARLPGDRPTTHAEMDDDEDVDLSELAKQDAMPSPMIPRNAYAENAKEVDIIREAYDNAASENPANFQPPTFDLTVLGMDATTYLAAYQGRQVELDKVEAATIRKVVLTAIKRTIAGQLAEVDALLPKRKRRKAKPFDPVDSVIGSIPAPRKRGRPRKVTS